MAFIGKNINQNKAWNLYPYDNKVNADSSFHVKEGCFFEITAFGLADNEKIIIVKIVRDLDRCEAESDFTIPIDCCSTKMEMDKDHQNVSIGSFGEYIIARQTYGNDRIIKAHAAKVLVTKHVSSLPQFPNSGFCCGGE